MKAPAPITGRAPGEQQVGTPPEFIKSIEERFSCRIIHDLAASHEAHVCESYFTRTDAALRPSTRWPTTAWNEALWLNPPFSDIPDWLDAVSNRTGPAGGLETSRRNIFVLLPASTDSEWFANYVQGRCAVYWMRPRITFLGHRDLGDELDLLRARLNRESVAQLATRRQTDRIDRLLREAAAAAADAPCQSKYEKTVLECMVRGKTVCVLIDLMRHELGQIGGMLEDWPRLGTEKKLLKSCLLQIATADENVNLLADFLRETLEDLPLS
jgi:hypothetical protein